MIKGFTQIHIDVDQFKPVLIKAIEYFEKSGEKNFGDYFEFGVFNGTSITLMYKILQEAKIDQPRLFGFDSFEGLPEEAAHHDDGFWYPGQFKCDFDFTKETLEKNGVDMNRTHLIKGFYSDTLTSDLISKYKINKVGIIMVDCDLYTSAREALDFCAPLIGDRAIIIFDDWGTVLAEKNLGEKKAFTEFLANNKHFKSTLFAEYSFHDNNNGKVFLIERP